MRIVKPGYQPTVTFAIKIHVVGVVDAKISIFRQHNKNETEGLKFKLEVRVASIVQISKHIQMS